MRDKNLLIFETLSSNSTFINTRDKISKKSIFEDDLWDFTDETKQRLNSVGDAKLKIGWFKYKDTIPLDLIAATKVVCFFYVKQPQVLSQSFKSKKGFKPNTIVQRINIFLDFLESLCLTQTLDQGNEKICIISTLKELSLEELQKQAYQTKKYIKEIKLILKAFCNPAVQKYLPEKVEWNKADIDNLDFGYQDYNLKSDTYSDQPLEDSLFLFLSKQATKDVVIFLKLLGVKINYNLVDNIEIDSYYSKYIDLFKEMFDSYVNIRIRDKEYGVKGGTRGASSQYRIEFKSKYGISVQEFLGVLQRFHRAAIFIVCQFTGVRYSEVISFQTGCLTKIKEGLWVIKGTVTKGENLNNQEGNDEWVACPIVRDAVNVLEEIQRFTFNSFLISPTYSVYLKQKNLPYTNSALNDVFNLYLEQIDEKKNFVGPEYKIGSHRLRHTLAIQFLRAKLGIPYISYHLKHLHSQVINLQNYINNVTLGYGNIAKELFSNATAIDYVKKEIVYDLYHPDSPVAGKNSEAFKNRRKAYYQGMQAEGFTIEEILELLQIKGVPFADVGLGYCGGKKEIILTDGTKEQPPCIGQLKCNPARCQNAIIPSSKIPHWANVYKHNKKMLEDPYFAHAKREHQEFMEEAKVVLTYLNVNVEEL
ncbi:tyrosine-type recombinase/integrase [Peribacillus butanolivorans]|uniref:tyrosine-type recombinase/integrase n=1 Tax=Peribacillus butanolivorans TaxID=421767 RepID=UPI0036592ACB